MGYVAVKGGTEAIENASRLLLYERLKGTSRLLEAGQIREQLHLLVDRVMGEGALYAPDLAALTIMQSSGDALEAAFMLRAFRATKTRVASSFPQSTSEMKVVRRISAAFKDIPGGQVLGPSSDYSLRLIDFEMLEDRPDRKEELIKDILSGISCPDMLPDTFPKVVEMLRTEGLIEESRRTNSEQGEIFDLTRHSMTFPAPRSAALQALARGETGGLLLLAYSNMRGYGDVHPTIGELRVGYIPVKIRHPRTGQPYAIGEIKVTEAEVISKFTACDGSPKFTLGYGLCFGQNETKAISMAVLDRAMRTEEPAMASEDQEFVLTHVDGIESMGFCNHYKLPHYVTFQSDLDRLRQARKSRREGERNASR
jgi:alpha-D-ribose 1-methylphosphonate 5-triphosphate synthase subunit PhnI